MWASDTYLIVAQSSGNLSIWNTARGDESGNIELNGSKIVYVTADHDLLYVATSAGVYILQLKASGRPLDVYSEGPLIWQQSLLKTSPYDVLEDSLKLERSGDQKYQEGLYHEAVIEYENAMQLIIDNTHALQEVPEERQLLTDELDTRLGKALLKAKIKEVQGICEDITQLSQELQESKRTEMPPEDVNRFWAAAGRVIKESRVLADAQSSDMLSLQLTHEIDTLDSILTDAMTLYDTFRETINQAVALTRQISNEWHKMERTRSSLVERKDFLGTSIERISSALDETEPESEVRTILANALDEYKKIFEQIDWIVSSSESKTEPVFSNREEATETIDTLLLIIPKRRDALGVITDPDEHEKERLLLVTVIQQALESAKSFKLTKSIKALKKELVLLDKDNAT